MRPFRWVPYASKRHAVSIALSPSDHGETLCGEELDVPAGPFPRWPHGCWPECARCDDLWRQHEGIPRRAVRA